MVRRLLALGLFLSLQPGWSLSPIPMPRPYPGGDYWVRNEHTWMDWEVQSAELSGRLCRDWPQDDQQPGALLHIDWNVQRWPVVTSFRKGDRLRVKPDEAGGFLIKDIDGNSWMKVDLGADQFCFVRAHARYVKPVQVTPVETPSPLPAQDEGLEE